MLQVVPPTPHALDLDSASDIAGAPAVRVSLRLVALLLQVAPVTLREGHSCHGSALFLCAMQPCGWASAALAGTVVFGKEMAQCPWLAAPLAVLLLTPLAPTAAPLFAVHEDHTD